MKKIFFSLLLTTTVIFAQNPGDSVFSGTKVHTIYLQFNQPAYWDSLTAYYAAGNEQYMLASALINGVTMDSIGVRLKGNASYAHPNNKKSFKLGFGEYKSLKWDGLKSVALNNCWGDPTFMREKIHLDFLRDAGIAAPRGNYAVVYLNGVLWGLYSMEESVDKRFLGNHYTSTTGNLYKAVDAIGTTSTYISDFLWYGTDTNAYKIRYELKTDEPVSPWADLMKFIDTLNHSQTLVSSLPQVLDVVSVSKAMAADNIFGNMDSYNCSGRNFYVYSPAPGAAFSWIVWDVGLSFGAYSNGPSSIENLNILYIKNAAERPLANVVFNTPAFRQTYLRKVCEYTNYLFTQTRLNQKIDSVAAVIRPYVYADTKKQYTNLQFETNINSDVTPSGASRIPGLKSFINLRRNSILTQLSGFGITCSSTISASDIVINEFAASNTTIPDPAGEFEDWIELYNNKNDTLDLSGVHLSDDFANLSKWTFPAGAKIAPHKYLIIWADEDTAQIGLHANFKLSASGEQIILTNSDGVLLDSVSFGVQMNDLSMSRIPDGTGAFYQTQMTFNATNGTTFIIPPGVVVVNEVMTDNLLFPDPAGEFEPWIELYNTTSSDIELANSYLSDNSLNVKKWKFPASSVIPAKGYVIIWADGDSTQSGLHTSFTLPSSNGMVRLLSSSGSFIDSMTYTAIPTNKSFSRIPNGTGSFVIAAPTPNYSNSATGNISVGELVINEFAADNDSIADPAGETDDWIEFYNNTTHTIDLSGLYLSDSYSNVIKWKFPDGTILRAGYYLIVWADQDTAQIGLHATFALSASGERIILSNKDLTVIDSVSFGAQIKNKTMARKPNGTGNFVLSSPTFGYSNTPLSSNETEYQPAGYRLDQNYPNPFNPTTTITYSLAQARKVNLTIYNMLGEAVITLTNEFQSAGIYKVQWNGMNSLMAQIPSGIYFYKLTTNSFSQIRKMILLK